MAKNKEGRPEWFKFWRRNRRQLDIEQLSTESRGIVFTNMMRYFDGEADALLPMTALEAMAFNVLKINIDDSFSEYAEREEINRANGRKGGRPPKTEENPKNPLGFEKTEKTRREKTEERSQKSEDRSGTGAGRPPRARFIPPSLEEVKTYCSERHSPVDPERFFEYFEAGGWVDAKGQPVKSWKQKLLTWERSEQAKAAAPDMSWRTARPRWEAEAND